VEAPERVARPGLVVLVEGLFLHRDELVARWDRSVFLDVPFAVSVARMARRDGSPDDPRHPRLRRYVEGQQRYFAACAPWERATIVIDNSDVDQPRIRP
jgi:uridine kinase